MKRWFCLILAALMIVPVLAIGASAAEIYEFEFFERPAVLSDGFDFSFLEGNYFACPMELPEGIYVFSVSSPSLSFVSSPAEVRYVSDPNVIEFPFCYFDLVYEDRIFQSGLVLQEDFTLFICPYFDDRYTIKAERVGNLPGSGGIGLSGFLDSVSSGLIEYSTSNLVLIIVAGLVLACSPLLAWFGYRFIKRKVTKSVFKGRL